MLKLLIPLTLFISLFSNAQVNTPKISFMEESYPEVNAMLNSYEELYLYLLNQDDLDIQLSIPSYNYREFTKEYTNTYKQVLKQAINIDSSAYVIFRADTICHTYPSLTDWCHELNIHKIHQKIDPNNVITYLLNLHPNNPDNQQQLIAAAENGHFSNIFYNHNTLELSKYIQTYINDNPEFLNQDNNKAGINDTQNEIALQLFIDKGLSTKEELLLTQGQPNINILSLTIGMYMANALPNYNRELFKICQNNYQDECIAIAKILANDKTLFNQNLANRMLIHRYQLLGFDDEILKLEKQQKTFYKKIECYSAPDVNIASIANKQIANFHIQNLKEFGEVQALKLLAFKVYNIEKEHGYNPDFNPNDCE